MKSNWTAREPSNVSVSAWKSGPAFGVRMLAGDGELVPSWLGDASDMDVPRRMCCFRSSTSGSLA
eukprot:15451673-Alexandrium_andersonii.AAC.1